MPDRLVPPGIRSPREYQLRLPAYESITLKNGVPVYLINGGSQDVIKVEWVFRAGNTFESKPGVAAATSRLLKGGTKKNSSFEISNHFEYYGSFLTTGSYHETAVVSLEGLTKHLAVLLPLVREIFTEATFPESEIDLFKQNSVQRLEVNLKKSEFIADRLMDEALYGPDHPYGRKVEIDEIRNLAKEDLVTFYENYYKQGNCKVFVSGNFPGTVRSLLENYFGDLQFNNQKDYTDVEAVPLKEKLIRKTIDEESVQGAIRLARPFPSRRHPDFKKALVLNTVLGGYFGSRLMSNIREEKGYTYGIYSYMQNHFYNGAWVISTEAGRKVAEATIEESFKEMKALQETAIAEEELTLVKNYLIGRQLSLLDGPFQIMSSWKGLILNNLKEDFYYDTIEVIKNVTSKELQEIANKYFNRDDFYNILVV